MTAISNATPAATWVAIDIAKRHHAVVVETPEGKQRRFRMASTREDHDRLVDLLLGLPQPVRVAMEPTGDCHRTLAFRLLSEGIDVCLVSSVAGARPSTGADLTKVPRPTSPVTTSVRISAS